MIIFLLKLHQERPPERRSPARSKTDHFSFCYCCCWLLLLLLRLLLLLLLLLPLLLLLLLLLLLPPALLPLPRFVPTAVLPCVHASNAPARRPCPRAVTSRPHAPARPRHPNPIP